MLKMLVVGRTPAELKQNLIDTYKEFVLSEKIEDRVGSTTTAGLDKLQKEELKTVTLHVPGGGTKEVTQSEYDKMKEVSELKKQVTSPFPTNNVMQFPSSTQQVVTPSVQHLSEVDSQGFEWDSRIHASTRTKNKDGSWKKVRNLDSNLLLQVEQELRSASMASRHVIPAPPMPTVHVPMPTIPMTSEPIVAPTPAVKSYENVTIPNQPVGGKPVHSFQTFKANFPVIVPTLVQNKAITNEWLQECAGYFQVSQIWEIMNDDSKLNEFFEGLVEQGFITKV